MASVSFKRGDTWQPVFRYADADGNAIDLSGCSARMQARLLPTTSPAFTLSTADQSLVIDGPEGKVTAQLDKAVSAQIRPGKYKADLEITYTDGTRQSTDTFTVTVIEDITRDG